MDRVVSIYKIGRKIGKGAFGASHLGVNTRTGEEVIIKLESTKAKHPLLLTEIRFYRLLEVRYKTFVPDIKSYGNDGVYTYLVMEVLGPSLQDLFIYCNNKFSLKTVLMLADELIRRVEFIHTRCTIHRDIKPENFLMGLGCWGHKVYAIDFGVSLRYLCSVTHQHRSSNDRRKFAGTLRYASVNALEGCEQSRRDDMISLGYVLVYFLTGSLPWQGHKRDSAYEIREKKKSTPIETLCQSCPAEFVSYMKYCTELRYLERPNYKYLRSLFSELLIREGYEHDYVYDWTIIKDPEVGDSSTEKLSSEGASAGLSSGPSGKERPLWTSGNRNSLPKRKDPQ